MIGIVLFAAPQLAEVAARTLPDEDDAAIVVTIDGRAVLAHHPAVLERRLLPGSVMKLFTAYAILEAGHERSTFTCRGTHVDAFGQRRPCWTTRGHGPMQLRTAIAESCNVWFYEHAGRSESDGVDFDRVFTTYERFGFGAKVEAAERDLIPRTVSPRDLPDIAVGDHISVQVSPLSLVRAVGRIATRGGGTDLDPRLLDLIAEGMREAALGGTLAGKLGPDVAAKTGTAKKIEARGMRGLVVGFLPASRPAYVFVVVKGTGRGAKDAGPAAKAILEALR